MRGRRRWVGLLTVILALLTVWSGIPPSKAAGSIQGREITWLVARPPDGATVQTVEKIAAEYAKLHPGFKLNVVTTPDRPSYLQRMETLAVANRLPEFFDTDATAFAQKLRDQGKMVNVAKLLADLGKSSAFRPIALDYQRFDDGSLYMLPLEFQMEFFWYNKAIFKKAGVQPPSTLDDLVKLCAPLRAHGYIPLPVDGVDGWPLQRYMAFIPFRLTANGFIKKLKRAQTTLATGPGMQAAQWVYALGKAGCFQQGLSSQTYNDARDLFTSGKAAIYYMGTWELPTFTNSALPAAVRQNIDFFTLPTITGATTNTNEYFVDSGIGMAVASKPYDALVKDFLKFLLDRYSALYSQTGAFSPIQTALKAPAGAPSLYTRVLAQLGHVGNRFAMPWDTQLDPTSNTRMQQELALLMQGQETPKQFVATMDGVIQQNAPQYFK